LHLIIIIIIIL